MDRVASFISPLHPKDPILMNLTQLLLAGEVSSGEPLAPREAEKHQDGGIDCGSKPSKVKLTEEQKVRTEAFFMPPAFSLLNMEKVS